MQFPDSDFWDFSIIFYQLAGVEQSCLELQDSFNLNVNLILFCHWLALEKKQCLTTNQWQQLIDITLPWESIIKPLRESRRTIKNSIIAWPEDFKQETIQGILNAELNTERMQQLSIEQSWKKIKPSSTNDTFEEVISGNISLYLSATHQNIPDEILNAKLQPLLTACHVYQENKREIT